MYGAGDAPRHDFIVRVRVQVLTRYKRLVVGRLEGAPTAVSAAAAGEISDVPFAEIPRRAAAAAAV